MGRKAKKDTADFMKAPKKATKAKRKYTKRTVKKTVRRRKKRGPNKVKGGHYTAEIVIPSNPQAAFELGATLALLSADQE